MNNRYTTSKSFWEHFRFLEGELQENVYVLGFNSVLEPIDKEFLCGKGTVNKVNIDSRSTFRNLILCNAVSAIIAHNHPSGDPTPSPGDLKMTELLVEQGKLLEIPIIDHIIIGKNKYFSFADNNIIKKEKNKK